MHAPADVAPYPCLGLAPSAAAVSVTNDIYPANPARSWPISFSLSRITKPPTRQRVP